jgi:hypothetical protein
LEMMLILVSGKKEEGEMNLWIGDRGK